MEHSSTLAQDKSGPLNLPNAVETLLVKLDFNKYHASFDRRAQEESR